MNLANPLPFFLPSRACTQRGGGRAIDNRKIARASPPNRISRWPPVLFAYRFQRFVGNNDGVASTRLWGGGGKEENECGARGNKAVGMSYSGEGLEGGRGRSGWIYDTLGDAFFFFFQSRVSICIMRVHFGRLMRDVAGIFFFFFENVNSNVRRFYAGD